MHELAICETICKTIEKEAGKRGMKKVSRVKLRIGKMEAFDHSHLDLALKAFGKNELFSDTVFEIEEVPVTLRCEKCGNKFMDTRFDDHEFAHQIAHAPLLYLPPACPKCDFTSVTQISGNEMGLTEIES